MANRDRKKPARDEHPHSGRSGADAVLVAALAAGATHEQAASQAGVSVSTVARRLKDPAFQALLKQARANLLQTTTEYLVAASVQAEATLRALLGPENPAPVRLGAARCVLDFALRFHNELLLAERVTEIEQKLGRMPPPITPCGEPIQDL